MSKNTTKKSSNALVWAFYIFAILMLILACYMVYSAVSYLASYAATYGTSLSSMKSDVFQYVVQQAAPYLTYAALLFGTGKTLSVVKGLGASESVEEPAPALPKNGKRMVVELVEEAEEEPAEAVKEETEEATETVETEVEEIVEETTEEVEEPTEENEEEAEKAVEEAEEKAEEAADKAEE